MTRITTLFLILLNVVAAVLQADDVIPAGPRPYFDFDRHPEYQLRETVEVGEAGLVALWTKALDKGGRELLCNVAESAALAYSMGHPHVNDELAHRLLASFKETDDRIARISLAKTLVLMDFQAAEAAFAEAVTEQDYALCRIIEPALARWANEAAIERNLKRIQTAGTLTPWRILAISALGESGAQKARDALLSMVQSNQERMDVRLESARALSTIFRSGLESEARELLKRPSSEDRFADLLAIEMVDKHNEADVIPVLEASIESSSTSVQSLALAHLVRIDPERVAALVVNGTFSVAHSHPTLRASLITACHQTGGVEQVRQLFAFLDDPHPGNRQLAADAIFDLAQNSELRAVAVDGVLTACSSNSWRVLEQACHLAAALELKNTADRMLELVSFERPEVRPAAAFAIKEFQLPETLDRVVVLIKARSGGRYDLGDDDARKNYAAECLAVRHLCELVGRMKHPAQAELTPFVGKADEDGLVLHSPPNRATAIVVLGQLEATDAAPAILARLNDIGGMIPEYNIVREASGYSLGYMKEPSALPDLQKYASREGTVRDTGGACAWAIEQLGGEALQLPGPFEQWNTADWFLRPIEE
ncbi:MAG: hypothetical protein R3C18_23135 [Planctomycetaceae bacterium]